MNIEALRVEEDRALIDLRALVDTATKEARGLSEEEKRTYDDLHKSLTNVGAKIVKARGDASFFAALDGLTGGSDSGARDSGGRIVVSRVGSIKTFGQRYVESEAFKWLAKSKTTRSGQWTSDGVEIPRAALAYFAALTEDPASGGALVPPDYQPGIVPGPIQPIVVADLLAPGITSSNSVPTMLEKSYASAAAPVLEGGVKPESTLTFELASEPVRKLAHWIPVSEELLEDSPAVASYVDARLRYGVLRKEDQQLLLGTGLAPELFGILLRPGLAPDVARVDPATNADAILAQIVAIESTTGLVVTGIVMNPLAWGSIASLKDNTDNYIGNGPFAQIQSPTLWGRQIALTDQIAADVALVGAFRAGAQVFRNGGVRVNATNAHSDFFVKNMVAIRAEERLALAVYRPSAFGKVTGLSVVGPTVP